MWDVVIAGAGPAGSITATILARAGVRVLLLDRARFPRAKLCGDSLNPGTVELLRRLNLAGWIDTHGTPIQGMLVTGPGGVSVEGRYPAPLLGRTIPRCDLDYWLLGEALRAGAQFDERVTVRHATVGRQRGSNPLEVTGLTVASRGRDVTLPARVTIAADGRRSTVAFALGLARHPPRPRRWAVGGYFAGVSAMSEFGEMHVRAGEYIGVAPVGEGLTNACLVTPGEKLRPPADPQRALRGALDRDPRLRERFAQARMVTRSVLLGPLAVETEVAGMSGLLLAGDAAGFIDPMTGDGMRFAVRGAQLAADAAMEMLATGRNDGHLALAVRRRTAFRGKWRFNRILRRLVGSPAAVSTATAGAWVAPALVRALIHYAGDCGETQAGSRFLERKSQIPNPNDQIPSPNPND